METMIQGQKRKYLKKMSFGLMGLLGALFRCPNPLSEVPLLFSKIAKFLVVIVVVEEQQINSSPQTDYRRYPRNNSQDRLP